MGVVVPVILGEATKILPSPAPEAAFVLAAWLVLPRVADVEALTKMDPPEPPPAEVAGLTLSASRAPVDVILKISALI